MPFDVPFIGINAVRVVSTRTDEGATIKPLVWSQEEGPIRRGGGASGSVEPFGFVNVRNYLQAKIDKIVVVRCFGPKELAAIATEHMRVMPRLASAL